MATTGKIPLLGFTAGAIKYLVLFGFSTNPAVGEPVAIAMSGSLGTISMSGSGGPTEMAGSMGSNAMTGAAGN